MNKVTGGWKVLELGARNGIMFGALFEVTYRTIYQWNNSQPERLIPGEPRLIIDLAPYPFRWWYLPLLSTVSVPLASLLVHRLLSRRTKSTILLWQLIGLVALLGVAIYGCSNIVYGLYMHSHLEMDYFFWEAGLGLRLLLFPVLPLVMAYNLIFAVALDRGGALPGAARANKSINRTRH
jgi:4-amino-4-deoxy-L-arabinose transferase-like glycosyltransferase